MIGNLHVGVEIIQHQRRGPRRVLCLPRQALQGTTKIVVVDFVLWCLIEVRSIADCVNLAMVVNTSSPPGEKIAVTPPDGVRGSSRGTGKAYDGESSDESIIVQTADRMRSGRVFAFNNLLL